MGQTLRILQLWGKEDLKGRGYSSGYAIRVGLASASGGSCGIR